MTEQLSSTASSPVDATGSRAMPPVRRSLGARTAQTVEKVLTAALEELRAVGYDALTVRSVAARAEVAPATAYTYFSSKQHLVAELFARTLDTVPVTRVDGAPARRLAAAMRDLTGYLAREPELAAAATSSLLSADEDVARIRLVIGRWFIARFSDALGDDADPAWLELTRLTFTGALLEAGMGFTTYEELGERLEGLVPHIVGGT